MVEPSSSDCEARGECSNYWNTMPVIIYFFEDSQGCRNRGQLPFDLFRKGEGRAALPFAFQDDSNEAKRLLCNL